MIGIDIVEIKRIERAMTHSGFLTRIFDDDEREFLMSKNFAPQTVAGLFAAKEAVSKALGSGLMAGVGFYDIVISHDELGRPSVSLTQNARDRLGEGYTVEISISHEKNYAVAVCLITK